jgi:hypothetical protein
MPVILDEKIIKDKVRQYVDPLLIKLRENLYGSGTSYNINISKTVLPTDTLYEGDIEEIVTAAGFIKGIITRAHGIFLGSNQKELNLVGSGSITVSGYITADKTTYIIADNPLLQTLVDAPTITWNTISGAFATVTLIASGSRDFAAPSNIVPGRSYVLRIIQGASGTITWNSAYKWPNGTPPTLSTTSGFTDIATFITDGISVYGVLQKGFA